MSCTFLNLLFQSYEGTRGIGFHSRWISRWIGCLVYFKLPICYLHFCSEKVTARNISCQLFEMELTNSKMLCVTVLNLQLCDCINYNVHVDLNTERSYKRQGHAPLKHFVGFLCNGGKPE